MDLNILLSAGIGFFGVIIGVIITATINHCRENKKYRILLLDDILGYRYQVTEDYKGETGEFTHAINRIVVVYNSSEKVIEALKNYKKHKNIDSLLSLIKAMCKNVEIKYDNLNDSLFSEPFVVKNID